MPFSFLGSVVVVATCLPASFGCGDCAFFLGLVRWCALVAAGALADEAPELDAAACFLAAEGFFLGGIGVIRHWVRCLWRGSEEGSGSVALKVNFSADLELKT